MDAGITLTLSGDHFSGTVDGITHYVGGFVGRLMYVNDPGGTAIIDQCYSSADVSVVGANEAGGFVGEIFNISSSVKRSYSIGTLNPGGPWDAGGLVGHTTAPIQIENCYSRCDIGGTGSTVGGLIGNINDATSTIVTSYSTGEVTGGGDLGGLIGWNINSAAGTACFWDTDTSGETDGVGNPPGTPDWLTGEITDNMKTRSTFTDAGWDFTDIWAIDPTKNDGYPYLRETPTKVHLTGPATVAPGAVSGAFTLESQSDTDAAANVEGETVFDLSSDSGGTATFYSDAAGTIEITQLTIAAGTSQSSFYYKDTQSGAPTVTAAYSSGRADLGSDTHQITVLAAYTVTYDANGATYTANAAVTLYAEWTANAYLVTFDANGGTDPEPASGWVTYGEPYGNLATTTRDGFFFKGWFTAAIGGTQVTSSTIVSTAEDQTLYAQWTTGPNPTTAGPAIFLLLLSDDQAKTFI